MKSRLTITLDPEVVQIAKSVARVRHTNVSALIEELLRHAAEGASSKPSKTFSQRWKGKFELRDDPDDELLQALKQRYDLESEESQ